MRKAKKTEKREIKINEKKEIEIIRKPIDEKLEATKFATTLLNISIVCQKHKEVWDKEVKENQGYIKFDKLMLISKTRAIADKIFNNYFESEDEGEDVENNLFYRDVIGKQTEKCLNGISEKFILTLDDIKQRLPAGFMGTLGSWARMVKNLNTAKMRGIARKIGIDEKELNKLFDLSNKYMNWVYQDIAILELL